MMKKGWKQVWRNLLFQHFELNDTSFLEAHLPKNCKLDSFDGKYYLGLVAMEMSDVRHRSTGDKIWFKCYNELNVRTYITLDGKPGVLFLSLDVDSLISVLGARVFYGLPYRFRKFERADNTIKAFHKNSLYFDCDYTVDETYKQYTKDTFAYWATERYFFVARHLGLSLIGEIFHKPWSLTTANATNHNVKVLEPYNIKERHKDILFCDKIEVTTSKLKLIKG